MPKDDDDFRLYLYFNGVLSESLDDYTSEVEAVAGSEDELIGPRLARWPVESCTCRTSQNLKDTRSSWCS